MTPPMGTIIHKRFDKYNLSLEPQFECETPQTEGLYIHKHTQTHTPACEISDIRDKYVHRCVEEIPCRYIRVGVH